MKGKKPKMMKDMDADGMKRGGKVKKHADGGAVAFKRGGAVGGAMPKMRMDKASRSGMVKSAGGMSPASPLSGAGSTKKLGVVGKPSVDREAN